MVQRLLDLSDAGRAYTVGHTKFWPFRHLSLQIQQGERIAIMGSSGSGKSTLLHVMGQLSTLTEGRLFFDGTNTQGWTAADRVACRRQSIGFVFQQFHLLPHLTAVENVAVALEYSDVPTGKHTRLSMEMLVRVGLQALAHKRPNELSGGECQRVAIARALIGNPKLVLADEPTGALDRQTADTVMEVLLQEQARLGSALVVVTHDPKVAQRMDTVWNLHDGALSPSASPPRSIPSEAQ